MKVCLFGTFVHEHMNTVLRKKLDLQGIEIIECHEDVELTIWSGLKAYWNLIKKHRGLEYDVLIIPLWRGSLALPLAKLISRKPILYYANASLYSTVIEDRKMFRQKSLQASFLHFFEGLTLKFSNLIIKESFTDIEYSVKEFDIDKKKFKRLLIGANESMFKPITFKENNDKFVVLYFGNFIPLHGLEYVIEAAKILKNQKNIVFKFCGEGQTKQDIQNRVKRYGLDNVEFLGYVEKHILLENIKDADICLGIFGKSLKASRVITNKVYEVLASQKPLITMKSEAVKEINLENNKNCMLISNKNPQELVDTIIELKENIEKRKKIALEGYKMYTDTSSLEKTSILLKEYLENIVTN